MHKKSTEDISVGRYYQLILADHKCKCGGLYALRYALIFEIFIFRDHNAEKDTWATLD